MAVIPSFYLRTGLNVLAYDARAEQDLARFPDHAAFYVAQARAAGGPVLELGSGTGRVAMAIAAAGIEVVGLELSEPMRALAEAKKALAPEAVRRVVSFVAGDMTDFDLGRRFRLIVIPLRGFQELLTVSHQRAALARIRDHLAGDGRLIMDLADPRLEDVLPPEDDTAVALPALPFAGGTLRVTIGRRTNDPLTQVLTEIWHFAHLGADGAELAAEVEVHSLRWTWRTEMRHLLDLAGFAVAAEHSDFDGAAPAYGGQQIWFARPKGVPGNEGLITDTSIK